MSLVICLLAIVLLGVAGGGFQSVMSELSKYYPGQPVDTVSRRFEVDGFVWGPHAPPLLRRRYIATQVCAIPAFLCLAILVWLNETNPDIRLWGTAAFCLMSFVMACALAWKVIRRLS